MKIDLKIGSDVVRLSSQMEETLKPDLPKDERGHIVDAELQQVFLRGTLGESSPFRVNVNLHAHRCRPYLGLELLHLVKGAYRAGLREGASELRSVLGISAPDAFADDKSPKLAFEQRDPSSKECEFLHGGDMKRYLQQGPYRLMNPVNEDWDLFLLVDGEATLISRAGGIDLEELEQTAARIWLTLEEVYQRALTHRLGLVNAMLRNAQAAIDEREADL